MTTTQQIRQYLISKDIQQLFVSLLESICIDQPEDVNSYIISVLEKKKRKGSAPAKKQEKKKSKKKEKKEENGLFINGFSFGQTQAHQLGGAEDEEDEAADEIWDSNSSEGDHDEEETRKDDLLEDKESDMIRRRYSVSVPRRIGISNESLKVDSNVKFPVIPKTEQERERLQTAIDACAVFIHLDQDEKKVVFDAMSEQTFEKDQIVIQQGDEGDRFYVVDSGELDVYVNDKYIKTYADGDSFGELALIYGTPRAATIKAKSDVRLWAIDRTTFRTILMGQTINRRKLYEDFLRQVQILKTLNDYERLTIADALEPETWDTGDAIVTQGEQGNSFYIIVEGRVVVEKDGSEVAKLKEGDYFGEMALMYNQPRAATVTAAGPVKTVRLDRRSFKLLLGPAEDILKRNTNLYNQIMSKNI